VGELAEFMKGIAKLAKKRERMKEGESDGERVAEM
jgi:hypothetical protein